MKNWYYDLQEEPQPEHPGFILFERMYCFDFDAFSKEDWQRLHGIFPTLPMWIGGKRSPSWFGEDDGPPPYLWASEEPPGLQVFGVLTPAQWRAWDEAFREQAQHLPTREV